MASGPRGRLNPDGPNALLLRSPELMSRTQRVGEYLRYNSAIPPRLSELAILVTARQWTAQIEWLAHEPIALKAGIDASVIADLVEREGRALVIGISKWDLKEGAGGIGRMQEEADERSDDGNDDE